MKYPVSPQIRLPIQHKTVIVDVIDFEGMRTVVTKNDLSFLIQYLELWRSVAPETEEMPDPEPAAADLAAVRDGSE